jgi:hypothetical protein
VRRRASLAALVAAAMPSTPVQARVWQVGPDHRLQDAVARARAGDIIELSPGAHHAQTAVITQQQLTLRVAAGAGGRPAGRAVLHADGAHAEGKAQLVIRGGDIRVQGLEFRGTRVPDGNGAGIRFERGQLSLVDCGFFDNEMGLLAANRPDASLAIERCDFGLAPHHQGLLHHLLYVGSMHRLSVRGCRFSGGWRGHLLKSRARRNHILCNQLIDGAAGEASYELDLPNGGLAWVVGNQFGQGVQPQNDALIAFGAEAHAHADSALFVAHNSFVNEAAAPATWVRYWPDRLPAAAEVQAKNNLMFGAAAPDGAVAGSGEGASALLPIGNVWRPLADLDRSAGDLLRLRRDAEPLPDVAPLEPRRGIALSPTHEVVRPYGLRPLPPRDHWRPGALQD